MKPTFVGGMFIEKSADALRRIEVRILRLPSSGPARWIPGAAKYFSSTMSATAATSRHHGAASGPVNGSLETSRIGFAPRAASNRAHWSTFARYWVVETVQGVGSEAP